MPTFTQETSHHHVNYKIYFDNKPLFLTDELTPEIEPYAHHDDSILIDELSTSAIHSMVHEMHRPEVHAGIFIHTDLHKLKHDFWKQFTIVKAAGTLTVNENKEILFIFRRGKWDLPKGKCEEGEALEDCAVRETQEETGLGSLVLEKQLINTYHTYQEDGRSILKETAWYLCTSQKKWELIPQSSEQISSIEWVKKEELSKCTANTYPSILDVLRAGGYTA